MKFYGVGVMLGGFGTDPEDIMQICKDHNFWYMGWDKEYFPDKHDSIEMMEEIIKSVHIGDGLQISECKRAGTYGGKGK